jgi:hypothetical protein
MKVAFTLRDKDEEFECIRITRSQNMRHTIWIQYFDTHRD